ncbi:MAG: hypothetical protein LBU39_10080 [Desulfobulbaceae bacterium]|jgi:hypothetical protein|nr:hypothetical protein [Desulfobulbaceae bacterium]
MHAVFSVASLTILPLTLTCAVLLYEKSRRNLRQKLDQTERELSRAQAGLRELRQEQREAKRFANAFGAAEISQRLRQTHGENRKFFKTQPPERYRYASSLIACGVEAGQLAEGLSLSRQEAEQLVALARLAERRHGGESGLKNAAEMPIYH